MAAVDAGQESGSQGRCTPFVILTNKDIVDSPFGDVTLFVDEDHVSETLPTSLGVSAIVEGPAGGFVAQQWVSGVDGRWPEMDAQWRHRLFSSDVLGCIERADTSVVKHEAELVVCE